MRRGPRTLLLSAAAGLACTGCLLPNDTIDGADRDTTFGALRASWILGETPTRSGSGTVRTLIDVEVSGSSSGFEQRLASGQAIAVGGTQFVGPGDADVSFDLVRVTAGVRGELRSEGGLGVAGLAGLGLSDLDLSAELLGQGGSESFTGYGPLLGVGVFYEPAGWVRLFVEGSVNPTIGPDLEDLVHLNALDAGVRFRLGRRVELDLGWREVNYRTENDPFTSDLDLTASGPAFRLGLVW